MCLRSNWGASHIADPNHELTLDSFCNANGNHCPRPIPLDRFVNYGHWFQERAVKDLDRRDIQSIHLEANGFKVTVSSAETFRSKRVVVAAGIKTFTNRSQEFVNIPAELASHSNEHNDLSKFKGKKVVVIGGGQSAFESAAILKEEVAEVEVISRRSTLNWVGVHPRLHNMGVISRLLYSTRDVGPAGISRLVAAPHLFRQFPRWFQTPVAYRSIRPAVAGWLRTRLANVPITLGRRVLSASCEGGQIRMKLDDGTERVADHALLATGFKVDIASYPFLTPELRARLETVNGYPRLKPGLESSVSGLHFLGKPAAWSFGPLLGFVSGTEFASTELVKAFSNGRGNNPQENLSLA
jgi:hypothetical protein